MQGIDRPESHVNVKVAQIGLQRWRHGNVKHEQCPGQFNHSSWLNVSCGHLALFGFIWRNIVVEGPIRYSYGIVKCQHCIYARQVKKVAILCFPAHVSVHGWTEWEDNYKCVTFRSLFDFFSSNLRFWCHKMSPIWTGVCFTKKYVRTVLRTVLTYCYSATVRGYELYIQTNARKT